MPPDLLAPAAVTLASIAVYGWTIAVAGRLRGRYDVKAPAVTGPPPFERALRIQANTLEQLVPQLALLWLCAPFYPLLATVLGAVWVAGRLLYALAYQQDPARRGPGFVIAGAASAGLFLGAAFGLIRAALA